MENISWISWNTSVAVLAGRPSYGQSQRPPAEEKYATGEVDNYNTDVVIFLGPHESVVWPQDAHLYHNDA